MPRVTLFAVDHLAVNASQPVSAAGWPVLVARLAEGHRAILDRCSHAAAALSGGRVRRGNIQCPLHGALFSLADGSCVGGAYRPLRTFPTGEDDGLIWVEVPDEAPSADDLPLPGF
ncbi:Rieske (2Fe-2S) protein [Polymorphobacter sp.]|uniref:Rieske (2Fe-2S) protein n=1 Tax=Polymorphobacter sp. TaxID=1909290 RepID=UPI003F6F4395